MSMYVVMAAETASQANDAQPPVTIAMLLFGIGVVMAGGYAFGRVGTRQWRGEYTKTSQFIERVWGKRWGRAAKAVYPYAWVFVMSIGPMLIAGYVSQETTGAASTFFDWLSEAFIVLFFVAGALFAGIVLINRPRFLVPPHAREFHGVFGDWVLSGFRRLRRGPKDESG